MYCVQHESVTIWRFEDIQALLSSRVLSELATKRVSTDYISCMTVVANMTSHGDTLPSLTRTNTHPILMLHVHQRLLVSVSAIYLPTCRLIMFIRGLERLEVPKAALN